MKEFSPNARGARVVGPVEFLDYLQLESNAGLALTDSGRVQEKTCILGVPCVTLRANTERPEMIEVGSNMLAGIDLIRSVLPPMRWQAGRDG